MSSPSLVIRNGTIVDGLRMPAYRGDLAIRGGKVVAMGNIKGDATRVINFFRGFLQEAGAGHLGQEYPRQAAAGASGRRLYSRSQIAEMWRLRRKGQINDADWARWEHEIIAAGREGRIAGALHPTEGTAVTLPAHRTSQDVTLER